MLVKFACDCARDLNQQIANVGGDPAKFPRTPELLRLLVDRRYPGLIINEHTLENMGVPHKSLIPGLTFTRSTNLVHGRRPGKIYLSGKDASPRMKLVYAQELFHRVLDNPAMASPSLRVHVDAMITYKLEPIWDAAGGIAVLEYLAEIAAMEFFLPYAHRCEINQSAQKNTRAIAQQYGIPHDYVARHLDEEYMRYFAPFHGH